MLILIKGAGDIATGIAARLYHSGFSIVMTDIAKPTTVRCSVAFSRAIYEGTAEVEGICARLASDPTQALKIVQAGEIAVLVDADANCCKTLHFDALVDAIIAKQNLGTKIDDAPIVIGVGPGFTAGQDCHAVIETQRGHDLGRVLHIGSAVPNTGIPGEIGGHTIERIIRAQAAGEWNPQVRIGDLVEKGRLIALSGGVPAYAQISGVIRGMLPTGTPVHPGMKAGDIDPRGIVENCWTISDKARAIGGGVLEAILMLGGYLK